MTTARPMRYTMCVIAALACSWACADIALTSAERAFIKSHPQIVVGGEFDWPPMDYVEDGVYKGAAKDYLDEIAERTGLTLTIKTGDTWSELLGKIRRREIDMLPMMYWSRQRGVEFNLTDPYISVRHYVYMTSGAAKLDSLQDLSGRKIAIPAGYVHIDYLKENYPDIKILEVDSTLSAIDAVITGRADAVIENTASISYYETQHNILGLVPAIPVHFEANNIHMAVRKDWPLLRDILQKALNDISAETTTRIMARWTGSESRARTFLTDRVELTASERSYLAAKGSISACVNTQRMPFEGLSDGQYAGIGADTLAIVSDALATTVSAVHAGSWREIERLISMGRCDIAPVAHVTALNHNLLITSQPYREHNLALATRVDAPYTTDLADLTGIKIGIVDGYSDIEQLTRLYPAIEFVALPDLHSLLTQIEKGNIYAGLDYVPTLSYLIRERFDGALKLNGNFPIAAKFAMATSQNQPTLASAIDKALRTIPRLRHQTIQRKWVAVTTEHRTDYVVVAQLSGLGLLAFLFLYFRYRELHQHRGEIRNKNSELAAVNTILEQKNHAAMHMAYHDQLTGLCNRAKLLLILESASKRADRRGGKVAVLFLDLDRFKYVNDSLGHDVGDQLLKAVAVSISRLLRDSDTLCRLGGDEFIVVLEEFSDTYSPCVVAQRIIDTLGKSFEIDTHTIDIGTSIGISVYPDDSRDPTTLIKYADSAMYAVKDSGRMNFHYYRKELSERAAARLKIESALRRALSEDNFSLVFQPIVNLKENRVTSAEALIRWRDPVLGPVYPDEFIPIAEETGLIADIGEWVLRNTCRAWKEFLASDCNLTSLAVNVSSIELMKDNIADRFASILNAEGVDGRNIEIEVTENAMVDTDSKDLADLQKLRALGLGICIDDFGTGYSSLSYLKKLPLHVIKIDRSFIQNLPDSENDLKISQAIIKLSHSLGYKVVAEGVETAAQLAFVRENGCDFAQGFLFSKPVTAAEFPGTMTDVNAMLRRPGSEHARVVSG